MNTAISAGRMVDERKRSNGMVMVMKRECADEKNGEGLQSAGFEEYEVSLLEDDGGNDTRTEIANRSTRYNECCRHDSPEFPGS